MTQNEGIDVSLWQAGINWQSVVNAGKSFAYIRAGEGLGHDSQFMNHWRDAKQAGILRGAYWYFRPYLDPLKQAETFATLIREEIKGDWYCGELLPSVDVEYNAGCGHDDDLLLNPSEWARRLKMMLEALKHNLQSDVIIYSSAGMIRQYVDPTGDELWLRDYGLWVANWGVVNPTLPKPFLGYLFHQYTIGQIDGNDIDFNRFNGDNVFDYAQMLYIRRTGQISSEVEEARETQRARYEKITKLFNAGKVGEAENEIKKGEG